mmetsp:Transcript_85769/g.191778  ORF Transcript_85769/g.191778 Transcript_85769/m.191778 type:complete len:753 (-) Transcript_85769:7-2265(-)
MEVHGRELGSGGINHVDVQGLRLVDVSAAVRCHVKDDALLDLPDRLVELLDIRRQLQVLHAAIVRNELRAQVVRPEVAPDEVAQQVPVHLHELAGEHAPHVEVLRVGLEGLVVAQDLGGAGRRHRCHQQRVPQAVLGDALLQARPVPAPALGCPVPEVELQLSLAGRRPGVALVRPVLLRKLARGLARREVNGLEDILVQLLRAVALEGQAHDHEGVGKALDTKSDGSVPHVGAPGLLDGVVVAVDDLVEVARGHPRHLVEALEVVLPAHVARREGREGDGGEIADGDLVRRGVLDDLGAEVGAVDGAEVLLVGLAIRSVLVEHVGRARLHLRLQDAEPELLRLDRLLALARGLELRVHALEVLAPDVHEALAGLRVEGLIGAEERPLAVLLDAAHEEVGHPEAVEEVARALLLLAVVLPHLQEVEDVRVPGLQVHGEGALALAAALVHVARGLVEVPEHGHQAVAVAVGAADVGALRANVGDGHADAARRLRDEGALLEGVVDALDAVALHGEQEARGHLGRRGAGVEERGRRVREEAARHEVVRLDRRGDVAAVDAASDPHEHVLGPLDDCAVDAQEVRLLERLKTEVVEAEVAAVLHGRVQLGGVHVDELPDLVRDQRRRAALLVVVAVQRAAGLPERAGGVLVEVRHGDARRERREVRVLLRHVGASLRSQRVDLGSGDASIEALDDLLGDGHRVHECGVQATAQLSDPPGDAVKLNLLVLAVTLDHVHLACHRRVELMGSQAEGQRA